MSNEDEKRLKRKKAAENFRKDYGGRPANNMFSDRDDDPEKKIPRCGHKGRGLPHKPPRVDFIALLIFPGH